MKARLLAVLLVSTLVLASAAPMAFSQASAGEGGDSGNVTIVDCSQVQSAFGSQGQYGNAAVAQYESEAVAVVSQELNISQNQVNACLGGGTGGGGDNTPPPDDDGNGDGDDGDGDGNGGAMSTPASDEEQPEGEQAVDADTIPAGKLPNTGGPSLLAAVAGVALVVGGASLIRFRR